ncbi:MAG TPA: beta-galactosidase [Armatimonadota bacterium]|nr:beta-galactosidase [Armatimonadota bacterium]
MTRPFTRRTFLTAIGAGAAGVSAAGLSLAGEAAPAPAQVAELLFDGKDLADWSTERDAARLQAEFIRDTLELSPAHDALDWQFISRGVTFNDIFLHRPVRLPFNSIHVRLRNLGSPLILACKAADADGSEWTANRISLQPGSLTAEWQDVEFPRDRWQIASWSADPDGKMDGPLRYYTLIAFDLQPGTPYHLQVQRIEVLRPTPPTATITHLEIPARMKHGESYPVRIDFRLDRPCSTDGASLAFLRDGVPLFRVPLSLPGPLPTLPAGKLLTAQSRVRIPGYSLGGRCTVSVELGEAVTRGTKGVPTVEVESRHPGRTAAAIHPHRGKPTLFLDTTPAQNPGGRTRQRGQPHNPIAYMAYGPSSQVYDEFAAAGLDLFSFSATPTESGYGLARTAWLGPGRYDFSELDERVMMALDSRPGSYFFPRLYLHAPRWWSDQHPNDLVQMDPGDGHPVLFIHEGGKPAPSWASEAWRRDTVEGLRRLIAHVEASPYADRCIGYHLTSGTTEEWMMWGANEGQWVDYSPVNQARFGQWLRSRYGTVDRLRAAWRDSKVRFETARVPSRMDREYTSMGSLRDPEREQPVIDFYLYNSYLVADTIDHFARAVKEITGGEKLVGVFYGYLLQLCGEQRQQNAGHLALARVLRSPYVDFLCSPTSYAFRQLGGEGTSHFMSLLDSVQVHGKLWFDENDIRTSLSGGQVGEWGKPPDVAGDILQQEKELANVIVHGTGQWWFDVGGNRYDNPALMKRLADLTRISASCLDRDRSPVDQAAMIVDEESLTYLRVGDPLGAWLLVSQLPELFRAGSPVGTYLSEDLPRLTDRRIFLFMTGFAPSEETRRAIESLKGDGRVLVFFYAPGLYRNGRVDESAMESLTGIRLRRSPDPLPLRIKLEGNHPIIRGLEGASYGVDTAVNPAFYADDPDAATMGTLPGGQPGLVARKFAGWTSVYSAAPLMPASLLRSLFGAAGVHQYIETPDVVWATNDLLAVSVGQGGKRRIRLPRTARVQDLYAGTPPVPAADSFEIDFPIRATRLFALD